MNLLGLTKQDIPFVLRPGTDQWIFTEVIERDDYKIDELLSLGFTPATVWDIGGNIGLFSFVATKAWPGANVHTWEPNPNLWERLLKVAPTVTLHRSAAYFVAGKTTLFVHPDPGFSGGSCIAQVAGDSHEFHQGSAIEVVRSVPWEDAPPPDLVKIDCEGSEYRLLEFLPVRPKFIMVELHGPRAADPIGVLNTLRPEYAWEVIVQQTCPLLRGSLIL